MDDQEKKLSDIVEGHKSFKRVAGVLFWIVLLIIAFFLIKGFANEADRSFSRSQTTKNKTAESTGHVEETKAANEKDPFKLAKVHDGWDFPTPSSFYYVLHSIAKEDVACSSFLKQKGYDNRGYMAFDQNIETSWQEDVNGVGIGEYLKVVFDEPTEIDVMSFYLGNWRSDELWEKNSVPSEIEITINGKYSKTFKFPYVKREHCIYFPINVKVKNLRFTIVSAHSGTTWDDTSISEISFYTKVKYHDE